MVTEWTSKENVVLLGLAALFFAGAYLLTGVLEVLAAVIGVLVLGLWLLGAFGKLGISALR